MYLSEVISITDNISNNRCIYLTKFGSHLYGTNTKDSDTDYLGIFIPNLLDCLKDNIEHHKQYKTNQHQKKYQRKGIDRKAISHALRSICQMKKLLLDGFIKFPLVESAYLLNIKLGDHDWEFLESEIISGLEEVDSLLLTTTITGQINNIIINDLYKLIYKL